MTKALSSELLALVDGRNERLLACFFGLAVGDALGATNEFQSPGSFPHIDDIVGGGPFNLGPGQWTDDTSMALCLAQSLIERRRFDPVDQMQRYLQWYREGTLSSVDRCFDIGRGTEQALSRFEVSRHPYCGDPYSDRNAGNGSLMRLAPVPMAWHTKPKMAIALAGEQSLTTHPDRRCVDSCRYFCALLLCAIDGASKAEILDWTRMPHRKRFQGAEALCPEVLAVAEGSWRGKKVTDVGSSGYVIHSLETALWAFADTDSFAQGALLAANLGGDSDTNAAIYGMLAGAHYGFGRERPTRSPRGETGIPLHWLDGLAKPELLMTLATGVIGVGTRRTPTLAAPQAVVVQSLDGDTQIGEGWLFQLGAAGRRDYELRFDHRPAILPVQLAICDADMAGNPARRRIAGTVTAWLDASRCVVELREPFCAPPRQGSISNLMEHVVTVQSRDGRPLSALVMQCDDTRALDHSLRTALDGTTVQACFWQRTAGRTGQFSQLHFRLAVNRSPDLPRFVEQEFTFSFDIQDVHVAYRAPRRFN